MKIPSQAIVHITAFVIALLIGSTFDTIFWQISYHAKYRLDGKPLPALTGFFVDHHSLCLHLAMLPWLWLIGAPLFSASSCRNYWEPTAFVLRFLAFVTCEACLTLLLTLSAFLPFITYYWVLRGGGDGTFDRTIRWCFLFLVAGTAMAAIYRTRRWFRRRQEDDTSRSSGQPQIPR